MEYQVTFFLTLGFNMARKGLYLVPEQKVPDKIGSDEDDMGFTHHWKEAFSGALGLKASFAYIALPIVLAIVLSSYILRIIGANSSIGIFLNCLDGWVLLSAVGVILGCVSLTQSLIPEWHSRLVRWPLWLVLHLVITCAMIAIALVISGFVRWRAIQMMSGLG